MRIAVVCGTNRTGALSREMSRLVVENIERLGHETELIDMADLPADALSPNAYQEKPKGVRVLIDRFLNTDGSVFVIPEYNGSYPGVLKLFVDMLPFPQGFDARPCAFIGLAAGQFKALRAVEHFQQVAGYRNAHLFPRRVFIGDASSVFVDGRLADAELADRLREQASDFLAFIKKIAE